MENEKFEPWYHDVLSKATLVSFIGISYDVSGMRICLRDDRDKKRTISLHFPDTPHAVRITNESQRLESLTLLPKNSHHSFFLVKNSNFLAWLNTDSLDIYLNDPLYHLAIITDEEWIDLICNENSIVKIEGNELQNMDI